MRAERASLTGSRGARGALLAFAVACAAAGLWALFGAPRDPEELSYVLRDPLWPLRTAALNGFMPAQLRSHLVRAALLGAACAAFAFAVRRPLAMRPWRPAISAAAAAALVAAVAFGVLRGVPLTDDEPTYLYQAGLAAEGRLMDPPVPPEARWHEPFTVFSPSGTTGKYLPGEPLVLLPGVWAGVPILPHVALAALLVAAVYLGLRAAARRRERADDEGTSGEPFARWGAMAVALSPALVFTSAVHLSQGPALACAAVAVWMLERAAPPEPGPARPPARVFSAGLAAGLALGACAAIRPQIAIPAGAVLALLSWRQPRLILAMLLGALPFAAGCAWYSWHVTGSPLVPPHALWEPKELYGFGVAVPSRGYVHTPWKAILEALVVLVRMNGWALGWPVSLAGPIAWLALGRPRREPLRPWLWIAVATFAFQLPYYCTGPSDTGPVYHHAAVPFVALSTVAAIEALARTRWRQGAAGFALACAVLGTGTFYAEHALRLRRLAGAIDGGLSALPVEVPAIVFVETSPGGRRPAGWVFGPPYHSRRARDPVVYFPRGDAAATRALRHRWSGRHCYYALGDPMRGRFHLEGCAKREAAAGEP